MYIRIPKFSGNGRPGVSAHWCAMLMFQQHGLASLQLAAFSLAALVDLRLMKLSLLSQPPQKLRRGCTVFGAVTTGLLYIYPPALNGWREIVVLGFQLLFRVGLVTPRIPLWRAKRLLSASLAFDALGFGGRCIAPTGNTL